MVYKMPTLRAEARSNTAPRDLSLSSKNVWGNNAQETACGFLQSLRANFAAADIQALRHFKALPQKKRVGQGAPEPIPEGVVCLRRGLRRGATQLRAIFSRQKGHRRGGDPLLVSPLFGVY